jgi:hypothetical protein
MLIEIIESPSFFQINRFLPEAQKQNESALGRGLPGISLDNPLEEDPMLVFLNRKSDLGILLIRCVLVVDVIEGGLVGTTSGSCGLLLRNDGGDKGTISAVLANFVLGDEETCRAFWNPCLPGQRGQWFRCSSTISPGWA